VPAPELVIFDNASEELTEDASEAVTPEAISRLRAEASGACPPGGRARHALGPDLRRATARARSQRRLLLAARAGSATGLPGYSDAFLACFLREHKGDTQVGPFFSFLPSLPHRPQSSLLIRFCSMLREKSMNTIAGSGVTT